MKREEFWIGVCIYLLIILAGHLGPDLSKIPFLNQRMTELFRNQDQARVEKLVAPMSSKANFANSVAMEGHHIPKRSGGYLAVQSAKFHSRLKAKGNETPSYSPRQAQGPISPISFSL